MFLLPDYTWCHNPKDHNFNLHCHENLKPCVHIRLAVCVDTKFFCLLCCPGIELYPLTFVTPMSVE